MAELKDILTYGISLAIGASLIVSLATAFFKAIELIGIFSIV